MDEGKTDQNNGKSFGVQSNHGYRDKSKFYEGNIHSGCVAFGRSAEFAEKYFRKGTKIAIAGRIQTGSYTNRDGQKVYTTEVVVEEQEFAESKNSGSGSSQQNAPQPSPDVGTEGFMNIPDGIEEELPFS